MLNSIIDVTEKYIEDMPKEIRKKFGQFFTSKETAVFMAGLFNLENLHERIDILDPGAGTGILACAFLDRLKATNVIAVKVTCYENDENVLPILKKNLELMSKSVEFSLEYIVIENNYILTQNDEYNKFPGANDDPKKYDYVIGNPPYQKISKDAFEASVVKNVCYGAPNLYFIFATMSIFNLKEDGQLVYIIPRSWTSGAYFTRFREYLFSKCQINHLHLFVSRDKVFEQEEVLQETMIIKLIKTTKSIDEISITSSKSNRDFHEIYQFRAPKSIVVSGPSHYVYLFSHEEDIKVLRRLNQWEDTLPSIGLKMKTGLVVDFRNRDYLRKEAVDGAVPLIFPQNVINGKIVFPVDRSIQFVVPAQPGFVQKNTNYLIIKRFTAKEEKRRLQCGLYLKSEYPQYEVISTQNKVNFIVGIKTEISEEVNYGLYALFNSTIYDKYYRILNGSTQVNSTEVNSMPVPPMHIIEEIGTRLLEVNNLSVESCDKILEMFFKTEKL